MFGDVSRDEVAAWLDRHVRHRLSAQLREILFRAGRLSPVYGVRLTDGSTNAAGAPTPSETAAFLADYDALRAAPFTEVQQRFATAAATWVLAYNARCEVTAETFGYPTSDDSALGMLARYPDAYLRQRW